MTRPFCCSLSCMAAAAAAAAAAACRWFICEVPKYRRFSARVLILAPPPPPGPPGTPALKAGLEVGLAAPPPGVPPAAAETVG